MKPPIEILQLSEILAQFSSSLGKVCAMMGSSGFLFWVANTMPAELSIPKDASIISGWALAVATIATLWRVCFKLFEKLEKRDEVILKLHEANTKREGDEADKLREELKEERRKHEN